MLASRYALKGQFFSKIGEDQENKQKRKQHHQQKNNEKKRCEIMKEKNLKKNASYSSINP